MVPENERESRIEFTSDTCILDDEHHFVRGVIELPIIERNDCFAWGVWVSLKKENFFKYTDTLDENDWQDIGPFFGWLCTKIEFYKKDTMYLKTMAHIRKNGLRPNVKIEPIEHPLSLHQQYGISINEVFEILHYYGIHQ